MNYRKGFGLFLSITFVFLVASLSDAAEFSADMTIQSATGGDLTGRVFVKGNDLRQELDTPVGTQTTIIDQMSVSANSATGPGSTRPAAR